MSKKTVTFSIQKKTESKCVQKNNDPFCLVDTKAIAKKKEKLDVSKSKPKKSDKKETKDKLEK